MSKAVIFDLDGTLVDSEPVYFEADREFFAAWGYDYDEETCKASLGMGTRDFFRAMEAALPGNALARLPLEERIALRDANILARAVPRIEVFPAMRAFVPALEASGWRLGIASGSSPDIVRAILCSTGLERHFPVVVSASEVGQGKPAPDVFLEAARRLGVMPDDCLVFEDSVAGVAGAARAGMACVALPLPGAGLSAYAGARLILEGGPAALDEAVLWRAVAALRGPT